MKALTLVLLWLLGSATAIGVAWSGVGVLDDDLVAPAPAVVNIDGEVGLASESVALDSVEGSSSLLPSTSTTSTTSPAQAAGDGSASSSVTPNTTLATTVTSTASSTPTSATNATFSSGASTVTTSSGSDPEPYETKTFTLIGGTTAIKFTPSYTKVLWASPNPGYEVRIEPESPGIKVEFRSDDHRSRIDAWWENGPRHEIEEDD